MRQEWLSLASEQQGPTATGFDSVSFPGVSFDHKHLTVEVEHRKLSINSGHWFLPIPAANNLANSVTPGPSMGIVRDCSASQTAAGQAAAQKHGSFLNQFASICLKISFHQAYVIILIQKVNMILWDFCHKEYLKARCILL